MQQGRPSPSIVTIALLSAGSSRGGYGTESHSHLLGNRHATQVVEPEAEAA
jgi:hypothetical protein